MNLRHVFCEFCSRIGEQRGSDGVGKNLRITAIEHHEGALACRTVDLVIVGELSKREPVAPIHLSVIDEDSEVFFNLLIDSFCLSIGLQVESHGCVRCDVKHPVEFLHEF